MKNRSIRLALLSIFLAVLPSMAWAGSLMSSSVLDPMGGGNSWDLYVFGNGRAVYEVLMAIKMLMVPTAGSTGYSTLFVFMAVSGFFVLAIQAGFNPGKNLFRLFGYILTAWMISLATTGITVNLNIDDLAVTGTASTSSGAGSIGGNFSVSGVPALVGLPAALTSQVGYYFTKTIEGYFDTPSYFDLSQSVGQFDLFGKMLTDSTKFAIQYPELKQSLSSYMSNCVVPAIAMGRLTGKGANSSTLTGVQVLLQDTNLWQDLKSAASPALMSTYYPLSGPELGTESPSAWYSGFSASDTAVVNSELKAPTGTPRSFVITCADAYLALTTDLKSQASAILNDNAQQWSSSGVMVPYETVFNSLLNSAGASGSSVAGYSSTDGYVIQQSLLNSLSPSFQQAAVSVGNNSLIQAAALAQAQQGQRSSWATSFELFDNMIGYVFTVLQVFIFALTPIVAVMLLVPGLGGSVFRNYTQILVWMSLWMPLLAVINFIITLFDIQSFSGQITSVGGLNTQNAGIISESSNNLVLAAEFLGTMVPMLAWGIVNGTLAFTEFIAHGIGSNFAIQAGATAASGNLSMGNMSLNNVSSNKYNPAVSSTVGYQEVNAFAGAGSAVLANQLGGSMSSESGQSVQLSRALVQQWGQQAQETKQVAETVQNAWNKTHSVTGVLQALDSYVNTHGFNASVGRAYNTVISTAKQYAISHGYSTDVTGKIDLAHGLVHKAETSGGFSAMGNSATTGTTSNTGSTASTTQGASESTNATTSTQGGKTQSAALSAALQQMGSELNSSGISHSKAFQEQLGESLSKTDSALKQASVSYSNAVQNSQQFSVSESTDPYLVSEYTSLMESTNALLVQETQGIYAKVDSQSSALFGKAQNLGSEVGTAAAPANGQIQGTGGVPQTNTPSATDLAGTVNHNQPPDLHNVEHQVDTQALRAAKQVQKRAHQATKPVFSTKFP